MQNPLRRWPGNTTFISAHNLVVKCTYASNCLSQYQCMNVVRPLVRVDCFQVHDMSYHMIFITDSVPTDMSLQARTISKALPHALRLINETCSGVHFPASLSRPTCSAACNASAISVMHPLVSFVAVERRLRACQTVYDPASNSL